MRKRRALGCTVTAISGPEVWRQSDGVSVDRFDGADALGDRGLAGGLGTGQEMALANPNDAVDKLRPATAIREDSNVTTFVFFLVFIRPTF